MFPEADYFTAEQLRPGLTASFERDITESDVYAFAHNSGDANPLHVNAAYAQGSNFAGRIVHGAFQIGLASRLIGMHLPGRSVLLGAVNAKFPAPLYYPCRVQVFGQLTSWSSEAAAGGMKVIVREAVSQLTTAEIHLSVTLHERGDSRPASELRAPVAAPEDTSRPIVLITGAGGGLGSQLVAHLAGQYVVLAMVRRSSLDAAIKSHPHVHEFAADLSGETWQDALATALRGRSLYGIVHTAWPGLPHGGLLQADAGIVQQQLAFGSLHTIELARVVTSQPEGASGRGRRIIALSSIAAATRKPTLTLASYSLGKAALEHTVRLLAPELARQHITINVISPSFIAAGMNKQSTNRQQMKEAALVPMGRTCRVEDVVGMVQYLLSEEAAFVSGQVIELSGAQL